MRTLRDINEHILDMSKSTWVDEGGAEHAFDPATWKKDLEDIIAEKSQLKTKTYYKPGSKPKDYIWWCRWNPPNNIEFRTARDTLPARAVCVDRDPYWPEGFAPDAGHGYFLHGDLVLMKRPYVEHLKDEIAKVKRSQGSAKALVDEFEEMTRREGMELKDEDKKRLGIE